MTSASLRIDVSPSDQRITLVGDLVGTSIVHELLFAGLRPIAASTGTWLIHASEARVIPAGAQLWIEAVSELLHGCSLKYDYSQLGLMLLYDDEYQRRHPNSFFEEEPPAVHNFGASEERLPNAW